MSVKVKARYILLAFLPYLTFYFLIQSFVTVSQYNLLTDIDEKIPFIPQFIWIYHSIVPVIALTAILLFQKREIFLGLGDATSADEIKKSESSKARIKGILVNIDFKNL